MEQLQYGIVGLVLKRHDRVQCGEEAFWRGIPPVEPFFRAGGNPVGSSPTSCRAALTEDSLTVRFDCGEGPTAYRVTSGGKEPMPRKDRVELALQGPNMGKWDFCVFAVNRDGTGEAFRETGMTYLGGGEAFTGGRNCKRDEGVKTTLTSDCWSFAAWQEDGKWGCSIRVPLALFGGKADAPFRMQVYRKKHQTSEILCPTALDLNVNYSDRFEYDPLTFLEAFPGDRDQVLRGDGIFCALPSGEKRWHRAGVLTRLSQEETERVLRWQKTRDGSFEEKVVLAQRWQDALSLDGVDFFFNQAIAHPWKFLEPWVERTQVNLCLSRGDFAGAEQRLDGYLEHLDQLTRWWYADHTLGNRGEDWKRMGMLLRAEAQPDQSVVLEFDSGKQLRLTAAVSGLRVRMEGEGFFRCPPQPITVCAEAPVPELRIEDHRLEIGMGKDWFLRWDGETLLDSEALEYRVEDGRLSSTRICLPLPGKGAVTGFGERFDSVNQRGKRLFLWQRDSCEGCLAGIGNQSYKNIPLITVENGYTLFANHHGKIWADVGCDRADRLQLVTEDDFLDVFVWSDGPENAMEHYTDLTGKPILPPSWVFEPWCGGGGGRWLHGPLKDLFREQYAVLQRFRQEDIPHSGFYAEGAGAGWTGAVHKEELYKIVSAAESLGIHAFSWQYPNMSLREAKALLPDCPEEELPVTKAPEGLPTYIDFTHPNAGKLLRAQWRDRLDAGIRGSMVDFGDVVPDEARFHDGRTGRTMHNGYAITYAKAYREMFLERYGEDHVLYTRGAGAGSQAYACQFGGDHLTSFLGLRYSICGGVTAAMSGLPFWGVDAGGYDGFGDEETYLRWTAFACFNPIMRYHGTAPREPWEYSPYAVDVYRRYAWLRENLLPYAWHHAVLAHRTGMSVLRPMTAEPGTELPREVYDTQYFYGSELLVAPVCQEGTVRDVWLPKGRWYALMDSALVLEGGQTHTVSAPIDQIPVFMREGACVPLRLNENLRLGSSMTTSSCDALLLTNLSGERMGTRYTERAGSYRYAISGNETRFTFRASGRWDKTYLLVRGVTDPGEVRLGGRKLPQTPNRGGLLLDEGWCLLEDGTLAVRMHPGEGICLEITNSPRS